MDKKLYCRLDKPYEAPTTIVFAIHSEGVLCQSYGDANAPGGDLSENPDNMWDL